MSARLPGVDPALKAELASLLERYTKPTANGYLEAANDVQRALDDLKAVPRTPGRVFANNAIDGTPK